MPEKDTAETASPKPDEAERVDDNRRRKWDYFHSATAMCLRCGTPYAVDPKLLRRKTQLSTGSVDFSEPEPRTPELFQAQTQI